MIDDEAARFFAELQRELHWYESRFRTWAGHIDLMAMSEGMPPEYFRRYVILARAWRAVVR